MCSFFLNCFFFYYYSSESCGLHYNHIYSPKSACLLLFGNVCHVFLRSSNSCAVRESFLRESLPRFIKIVCVLFWSKLSTKHQILKFFTEEHSVSLFTIADRLLFCVWMCIFMCGKPSCTLTDKMYGGGVGWTGQNSLEAIALLCLHTNYTTFCDLQLIICWIPGFSPCFLHRVEIVEL